LSGCHGLEEVIWKYPPHGEPVPLKWEGLRGRIFEEVDIVLIVVIVVGVEATGFDFPSYCITKTNGCDFI